MDKDSVVLLMVGLGMTLGFMAFLAYLISMNRGAQPLPASQIQRLTPEQYFGVRYG